MCGWNDKELSRMTPRLLTFGEGKTEKCSIIRGKVSTFVRLDVVPTRRNVVLSPFKEIRGKPRFDFR